MTDQTNLFYDSAADAARAAGVSDTLIIDQCKTGAIPGAYQSSDGWWRVPVDGMRAAGYEVTGEGAHLIGPLDRQLPEPTIATDGTPEWGSGVYVDGPVVYIPEIHLTNDLDFARAFALDVLAAAAWVEKGGRPVTEQTIPVDKLRALLDQWEGFTRDELHHVSAAGVLKELRDLLPDPPLPDPLFGARATHPAFGEGIVTSHFPDVDGEVRFMFPKEAIGDGTSYLWMPPHTLTFHTPDHPEFLETEEDYRSAPEGTIVAQDGAMPIVLLDDLWRDVHSERSDHDAMAGARRRVLRWRWEA